MPKVGESKELVEYNRGEPEKPGVYACRIPDDNFSGTTDWCKDVFLVWIDDRWGFPGSDQNYRGEVVGWIGPLQRSHK